jgi:hypothetical protein
MKLRDLQESSPLTFGGSNTPDLLRSKKWLCYELKKLNQKFSTIYILGSWYGNMAAMLIEEDITFKKIINVDTNKEYLEFSEKLLDKMHLGNKIESMLTDANQLNYRQLDADSLIINTSIQDIDGNQWWKNIPKGILVALQDRNNSDKTKHNNLEEFVKEYPMDKTMFEGEVRLEDPETDYRRWMKIGIK